MAQKLDQSDYIELVPLRRNIEEARHPQTNWSWTAILAMVRRNMLFMLLFVLPVVTSVIYFGLLLSPRYASEIQFTVRKASTQAEQMSQVVDTTGHREANFVLAYVKSRDALEYLEREVDIRTLLSRPEADLFWRFPPLLGRSSSEALYEHYLSFVDAQYDERTSISTWEVQAFRPEDAVTITNSLLNGAETLINEFNEQVRFDILRASQLEIALARRQSEKALGELTKYRIKSGTVDPSANSEVILKTIAELAQMRTSLQTELIERLSASPNSPQIEDLRKRIAALEDQIATERSQIGNVGEALAEQIAEFERLTLEREFSNHALASAYASLEAARRDAQGERLYIQLVASPREADYPKYPRRLLSIFLATAGFLAIYWIAHSLVRNFWEHAKN